MRYTNIVETDKGPLRGKREDGIAKYLGIPFAKPPIGNLRFKRPVPPDNWEVPLNTTSFKNSPMQLKSSGEGSQYPPDPRTSESEDCLYLNVFAPELHDSEKLPVMVWLYGGHYMNGSSTEQSCDGTNFSREQNVITVTFNYRVGIFGFMAHPSLGNAEKKETNAGLADMIAALKWIQSNISRFGGDPNRVTLFGVSAGSSAINVLMTCPAAVGLFQAAISQSGSPFNHDEWDVTEEEEVAKCQHYLSTVNLCTDQLETASSEEILASPKEYENSEFCPYVDGDLIPRRLEESFLTGKIVDVPVILGCTADEAFVLLGPRAKVSKQRFVDTVAQKFPDGKSFILNKYEAYTTQSPAYALGRFRSDNTIAGMRYYAKCLVMHRKSPTYFYVFQRVTPGREPYYFGAYHASENRYHFQNLQAIGIDYSGDDVQVSQTIAAYWANFGRTHNPNADGLPKWVPFSPSSDMTMYIDQPSECRPLKTKVLSDQLEALLISRTKLNNPTFATLV